MLTELELAWYFAVSLSTMRSFLRCNVCSYDGRYNLQDVKDIMGVR